GGKDLCERDGVTADDLADADAVLPIVSVAVDYVARAVVIRVRRRNVSIQRMAFAERSFMHSDRHYRERDPRIESLFRKTCEIEPLAGARFDIPDELGEISSNEAAELRIILQ